MQGEYGYDEFVHFSNYFMDGEPFWFPEVQDRAQWYGVTGVPHVRFDGKYQVVGAPNCSQAAAWYRAKIDLRKTETGGMSPVEITGAFRATQVDLRVEATFRLVDPDTLADLRATILVYEDNVYWCCDSDGGYLWQHVTRAIHDQPISLQQQGDEVDVGADIPLDAGWNPGELHVVAYLQTLAGNKEIIQGAILPREQGFTFDRGGVRSLPDGGEFAVFHARLTNIGMAPETFRIEQRGPFGDWPSAIAVCWDPEYHEPPSAEVSLDAGDTCDVWIRVMPDDTVARRSGTFRVTGLTSLLTQESVFHLFNGCSSILLVDDDLGNAFEEPLARALDALARPYTHWDVIGHGDRAPRLGEMADYDEVVWQTGYAVNYALIDGADQDGLRRYMDLSGRIFVTSQDFLDNRHGTTNDFIEDHLGVASWTCGASYDTLAGVAGDPIGDGSVLLLSFPDQGYNRSDEVRPGPAASAVFSVTDTSCGMIRNETASGGRSVFMPCAFNGVSETDDDPNNTRILLARILDWLRPANATSGAGLPQAHLATRIEGILPNPAGPSEGGSVDLVVTVSGAAAGRLLRLEVFDVEGRRVARPFDGSMAAGRHHLAWDRRSEGGRRLGTGIYFVRLSASDGSCAAKLVLLE